MKQFFKELLKSILAGMAVSFGAVGYLTQENHVVGGILFCLGLMVIYLFGWNLYTGKACYIVEKGRAIIPLLFNALLGNLIGAVATGYLFRMVKLKKLIPIGEEVVAGKLATDYFSGFVMAIGCGVMIYFAIYGYHKNTDGFGRYFSLCLPVVFFIVLGCEHVVANMFYVSFANAWNLHAVSYLTVVAVGNLVGCAFIPVMKLLYEEKTK